MAKTSIYKSNNYFSRFVVLSLCGWLLIATAVIAFIFKYKFGISFQSNIIAIHSYLTLYLQRKLILYSALIIILLFLLIIYVRIFSFKTFTLIKIILLMAPTLFTLSLLVLAFNLHQVISTLNIPLPQNIIAFTRFIQSFSLENIYKAVLALPYQLNSIKYPLYGLVYSYLAMFSLVIFFPLTLVKKTYTLWCKLNSVIALLFIGAFATSAYYLIINFVLHNPFADLEQIFSILSSL